MGYSPWGCEESDMTERLHFSFSLSRIGEGNGNPLQCSCLESPTGRGDWQTTINGVAKRWTQLSNSTNKTDDLQIFFTLLNVSFAVQKLF